MIDLGLSPTQEGQYFNALRNSHKTRTTVNILDMEMSLVQSLNTSTSLFFIDGQVDIDTKALKSRVLTMTILDPGRLATLDVGMPGTHKLWADRMIQVTIDTYVPEMAAWVECPVFSGPITKVNPEGYTVEIEAESKEVLLTVPTRYWRTRTWGRHELIGTIMRNLLHDMGEDPAYIDMPTFTRRTHHSFNMLGIWPVWPVLQQLATEINQQIFYDGSGTFRCRDFPATPIFTFTEGVDLMTVPQLPYDYHTIRNGYQVRGKRAESGRQPIGMKFIGAGSSLSPAEMGRNGESRFIIHVGENEHVDTKTEAQNQALQGLANVNEEIADLSVEALVMPFFDERDLIEIVTNDQTFHVKMMTWTIPLGTQDTMSIGFNKRVRLGRKMKSFQKHHGHDKVHKRPPPLKHPGHRRRPVAH